MQNVMFLGRFLELFSLKDVLKGLESCFDNFIDGFFAKASVDYNCTLSINLQGLRN